MIACSKPCNQCLFGNNKVVDERRKQEIIDTCRKKRTHFICHKGTLAGEPYDNIICYGWLSQDPILEIMDSVGLIQKIEPNKLVEK